MTMDRYLIMKKHSPLEENNINEEMVNNETTAAAEPGSANPRILSGKYFQIIFKEERCIKAQCQNCPKIISGSISSTGNFLSHIFKKHPALYNKVKTYCSTRISPISNSNMIHNFTSKSSPKHVSTYIYLLF